METNYSAMFSRYGGLARDLVDPKITKSIDSIYSSGEVKDSALHLSAHADHNINQEIDFQIQLLRKDLEKAIPKRKRRRSIGRYNLILTQWKRFCEVLDSEKVTEKASLDYHDEIGLLKLDDKNPFHQVARQILLGNIKAAQNLLQSMLSEIMENSPEAIDIPLSLREIWNSKKLKYPAKIRELLKKSRVLPELTLFLVIVSAVGLGINLNPETSRFLEQYAKEKDVDLPRYLLSFVGGVGVSFAIWSVKRNVLQKTAEAGEVLKGMKNMAQKNPINLATAAFISIMLGIGHQGYESMYRSYSENAKIADKADRVRDAVEQVIFGEEVESSVFAIHQRNIESAVQADLDKFSQIPVDEARGSKKKKGGKGPHYHFLNYAINGGYAPGKNDVALSYRRNWSSKRRDKRLQESNMDFTKSIASKMRDLIKTYQLQISKTEKTIKQLQRKKYVYEGKLEAPKGEQTKDWKKVYCIVSQMELIQAS